MKRIFCSIGAVLALSSCAMRKNLQTPISVPVIASNNSDGSKSSDPQIAAGIPNYNKNCRDSNAPLCTAYSTPYCAPDAKGQYPNNNTQGTSGMNSDGSAWAEGGGCVLHPIREVWAAFNNISQMKMDAADSYALEIPKIHLSPTITNFYQITYYKSTFIGSIQWTLQWFHGLLSGTFEQPQVVEIVYKRTSGTAFIPVWDGKIVLAWLNNSTTAFYIYNHFRSVGQSENDIKRDAEDFGLEMLTKARTVKPDWQSLNSHQ